MIDRSSRRRFGQNYLIDKSVIFQIVDKINPGIEDDFIEIGPGQGAITTVSYTHLTLPTILIV